MKKEVLLAGLLASFSVHAVEISKDPTYAYADVTATSKSHALKVVPEKRITLMNVKLTPSEKQQILKQAGSPLKNLALINNSLPSSVDIGMNNVPVLNQGAHGACVTFAATAALNALINKGDYISQLCSLELGANFEENGYMPSGWEGSFAPIVLNQLQQFGFVSKEQQRLHSCAGVYEYPIYDQENTGNAMNLKQFSALKENYVLEEDDVDSPEEIGEVAWGWIPIMNVFDRFSKQLSNQQEAFNSLMEVKKSLNAGNRVVFGTLIVTSAQCGKVACGSYKAMGDSWIETNSIAQQPLMIGGHEMVITGYDDNAVIFGKDGKMHMGLLKLRNSWGTDVGDKGNYYMSYEYFIKYGIEAQKMVSFKS